MSLLLFSIILVSCHKSDLSSDIAPSSGAIMASSIDSKGMPMALAEGMNLALFTEDLDDDEEYGAGVVTSQSQCVFANGYLYPNFDEIYVPEGRKFVAIYAYGPASPDDNITYFPENNVPTIIKLYYDIDIDQRKNGTASSDFVFGESSFYGPDADNKIVLKRQCAKLKFKLTSELNKDLSDAEVTLMGVNYSFVFDILLGSYNTSGNTYRNDVTAWRMDDGSFEVLIPEQVVRQRSYFVKVRTGGVDYIFENGEAKTLFKGQEYEYNLRVKDSGTLPFEAILKYGGAAMPNTLSASAASVTKSIEMQEKQPSGLPITFTRLRVRNADGGYCWVKLLNKDIILDQDVIYDGVVNATMIIEENLGAARSMTLEFYNVNMPKFVHKRVVINQTAAVNYLTLTSSQLNVDKWGTEYDFPQELKVTSNQVWTLENVPDWVTIQGYTPGQLNQTLYITVKQNSTGAARNAQLQFNVNGVTNKKFDIVQSVAENSSFTLKYELNLDYYTVNNKFHAYHENLGDYYASKITVFAKYENSDAAASIDTDDYYGYVVDAPTTFNHLSVRDFRSDYFIYKGYTGAQTTHSGINSNILGPTKASSQNFFRQIIFDLPIPPNVKRNQKVKYTVKIENILDSGNHSKAKVTYEIVAQ